MTDLELYKNTAIAAAKAGADILQKSFGKIRDIRKKDNAGLVTEVDHAAERAIIDIIKCYFPKDSILAEESGFHDNKAEVKWIIDPLDGTTNYAHQIPIFCTSIAVEIDRKIVVGAVSNPMTQDLYYAIRKEGAFKNDVRIHVSKTQSLEDAMLATGFAYQKGKVLEEAILILKNFMQMTHGIRRCGSAVWDLMQVAQGNYDGFWEKKLQPWDVATGILFVEEAGGTLSTYSGKKSSPYDEQIVASNSLLHNDLIEVIAKAQSSRV